MQDVFEDDSNVHMVMELCSGGSILESIKSTHPQSEAEVAAIVRCVLRFIAQCHIKVNPLHPTCCPPYLRSATSFSLLVAWLADYS